MELPASYKKLLRVTIYLNRYEKQLAEIEAARHGISLAHLGRTAMNLYVAESQKQATPLDEAMASQEVPANS